MQTHNSNQASFKDCPEYPQLSRVMFLQAKCVQKVAATQCQARSGAGSAPRQVRGLHLHALASAPTGCFGAESAAPRQYSNSSSQANDCKQNVTACWAVQQGSCRGEGGWSWWGAATSASSIRQARAGPDGHECACAGPVKCCRRAGLPGEPTSIDQQRRPALLTMPDDVCILLWKRKQRFFFPGTTDIRHLKSFLDCS